MALLEVGNLGPWWLELLRLVLAAVVGGGAGVWMSQRQSQKQSQQQAQRQKQAQEVDQRQQQEVTVGAEETDKVGEYDCGCYHLEVDGHSGRPLVDMWKRIPVQIHQGAVTGVVCRYFAPETGQCNSVANRRADRRCTFLLRLP